MGKIALKPLSFELGYFLIERLLDFITKRQMKKLGFKRFEKYGHNMGPVGWSIDFSVDFVFEIGTLPLGGLWPLWDTVGRRRG